MLSPGSVPLGKVINVISRSQSECGLPALRELPIRRKTLFPDPSCCDMCVAYSSVPLAVPQCIDTTGNRADAKNRLKLKQNSPFSSDDEVLKPEKSCSDDELRRLRHI